MLSANEIKEIRADFPYLKEDPEYIYFDNAATSQKPRQVIEAVSQYYNMNNGNPHRSAHVFAERATMLYEEARASVAKFINAERAEEIVFTKNASEGFNLVAYSWGLNNFKEGDEILLSIMEHHSNFVPWQFIAERTGANLKFLEPNEELEFDIEDFKNHITKNTKFLSITGASNVVGTMPDVKLMIRLAREINPEIKVMVDATQLVPHSVVDVRDMDCDFLAFSGHKMLSEMGVGVLYGKYDLLDEMKPFLFGGEMIERVTTKGTTFAKPPTKFEAGTVNVGAAHSLKVAIDYLSAIGMKKIFEYETYLLNIALDEINNLKGVEVFAAHFPHRAPVLPFNIKEVHPHDVATILSSEKVAIRSGHHCCEPLHQFLNINASSRASFSFYNTEEEVERFIDKINVVKKVMQIGDE